MATKRKEYALQVKTMQFPKSSREKKEVKILHPIKTGKGTFKDLMEAHERLLKV